MRFMPYGWHGMRQKNDKRIDEPHEIIEMVCSFMREWREVHERPAWEAKFAVMQ